MNWIENILKGWDFELRLFLLLASFIVLGILIKIFFSYNKKKLTPKEIKEYEKRFIKWNRKLSRPFKSFLSKSIKEFLNRLDGTTAKNKGEVDSHPKSLCIIYLLVYGILILMFCRYVFIFIPEAFIHIHWLYVSVEHIDVAGLLNGLLASILAIIIAYIVEGENKNSRERQGQTIDTINKYVSDILFQYTALKPRPSFEERLLAREEILKIMSDNPENALYIMNYSADFGLLKCKNINTLLDHISIVDQSNDKELVDGLVKKKSELENRLDALSNTLNILCKNRRKKVHILLLDTNTKGREKESPYEKYIKRVLKSAALVPIENIISGDTEISEEQYREAANYIRKSLSGKVNQYLVPEELATSGDLYSSLTESLVNDNNENIGRLKRINHTLGFLDRMSFQFILTVSPNKIASEKKDNCLVIFSNVDATGENVGVFAFQSTDPKIVESLIKIYENYQIQQKDRTSLIEVDNKDWKEFKNFFDLEIDRNTKTVLKFKKIKEQVSELISGTSMSSIDAAIEVQNMFNDLKENTPNIYYHAEVDKKGNKSPVDFSDDFFISNTTYFAVGLFGEFNDPLTLAEYAVHRCLNSQIIFERRVDENEKNILHIGKKSFPGIWTEEQPEDYALIAKLKLSVPGKTNISVFIIGGVNHFGTSKIARYLRKNWQSIYKHTGDNDFIKVFKIESEKVEEIRLG